MINTLKLIFKTTFLCVCTFICLQTLLSEQAASALPAVSYTLTGKRLMNLGEKILYKKTPQEDMYMYLLRPAGKHKRPLPAIVYVTGGGWVNGSVDGQNPNAAWFRIRVLSE